MAENNAVCSICGKEYHACLSCRDSMNANPWKIYTDTSEHYKVFQVVRGYNTNLYTKDEARAKFKNINLDDIESFRPHIKEIVKDILKEEKSVIEEVLTEEKAVIEKIANSRKRTRKIEAE